MTGVRSVPYYCPYCGGEDLRPSADRVVSARPSTAVPQPWECRECTRVFSVTLIGLVVSR